MDTKPTVEVVITNYKRPFNIKPILTRFREQTYPCIISLVDSDRSLSWSTLDLADRVYSLSDNYGPYNRFIPMGNYRSDFTYFHDDDMLPGVNLIRYFVTHVPQCPEGALFGQVGRINNSGSYNRKNIFGVPGVFTPVSMVVRGYFLHTEYLYSLLKFSRYFKQPIIDDDILLAWALKTYTAKLIYLPPAPWDSSEKINEEELPAPHAFCERPGHYGLRDTFWRECEAVYNRIQEEGKKKIPDLKPE